MKKLNIGIILLIASLLLTVALLSAAPTGFSMSKYVVGSGGGKSSVLDMYSQTEKFSLSGTMGQGVTAVSNSDTYTVASGYWSGTAANQTIYLPIILK